MRSALEILNSSGVKYTWETEENLINAINEARQEIIKECAEKARVKADLITQGNMKGKYRAEVDKESILNIINGLK